MMCTSKFKKKQIHIKISIEQVIVNCLQRLTAQISGKEWPRSLDELFAARVRAQTQTGVGEFIEKKSTIERTLRKFIESLHLSRVITLSSLNV